MIVDTGYPYLGVDADFESDLRVGLMYRERVLVDGAFSYHRFQEAGGSGASAADSSGNSRTGTYGGYLGAAPTGNNSPGVLSGDTASRYLAAGGNHRVSFTGLVSSTDQLTFEAWVRETRSTATDTELELFATTPASVSIVVLVGGALAGALRIYVPGQTTLQTIAGFWPFDTNWHYLAVALDAQTKAVRISLDGVRWSVPTGKMGPNVTFGTMATSWAWGTWQQFTGQLAVERVAEAAVYLTALEYSTMEEHFAAAAVPPAPSDTPWVSLNPRVLEAAAVTVERGGDGEGAQPAPSLQRGPG